MNYQKIDKNDNTQQTYYITWLGQEVYLSPRWILQTINEDSGKKIKEKLETRHDTKKRAISLAILKLIAEKEVNKKSHFEK